MRGSHVLYVTMLMLVALSGLLAVWVFHLGDGRDLVSYTISTVGFCVALLALFIAARTYASIDSVNDISKMDGNVLDNSNYVTSLPELIIRYKAGTGTALSDEIFESIEQKLRRESHTAVLFADTVQYMVDLVVLFPAIYGTSNQEKQRYRERMRVILAEVARRRDAFRSISKGNLIQIGESIKLFKAVVSYQDFVADGNFDIHAELLHVRGPVLRNPVTRTVYYNYLGLYYNKKAMHLIERELPRDTGGILSIDGLAAARKSASGMPPGHREEVVTYLRSACQQFDKAIAVSSEDFMWPGFIKYNMGRTLYFLGLFGQTADEWPRLMDEAIRSRSRLNMLIDEVLSNAGRVEDTHLRKFFQHQEELARLVNVNISLANAAAGSGDGRVIYKGVDLADLESSRPAPSEGAMQFSVVRDYWDAILKAISR